jgi:hypothetical protein
MQEILATRQGEIISKQAETESGLNLARLGEKQGSLGISRQSLSKASELFNVFYKGSGNESLGATVLKGLSNKGQLSQDDIQSQVGALLKTGMGKDIPTEKIGLFLKQLEKVGLQSGFAEEDLGDLARNIGISADMVDKLKKATNPQEMQDILRGFAMARRFEPFYNSLNQAKAGATVSQSKLRSAYKAKFRVQDLQDYTQLANYETDKEIKLGGLQASLIGSQGSMNEFSRIEAERIIKQAQGQSEIDTQKQRAAQGIRVLGRDTLGSAANSQLQPILNKYADRLQKGEDAGTILNELSNDKAVESIEGGNELLESLRDKQNDTAKTLIDIANNTKKLDLINQLAKAEKTAARQSYVKGLFGGGGLEPQDPSPVLRGINAKNTLAEMGTDAYAQKLKAERDRNSVISKTPEERARSDAAIDLREQKKKNAANRNIALSDEFEAEAYGRQAVEGVLFRVDEEAEKEKARLEATGLKGDELDKQVDAFKKYRFANLAETAYGTRRETYKNALTNTILSGVGAANTFVSGKDYETLLGSAAQINQAGGSLDSIKAAPELLGKAFAGGNIEEAGAALDTQIKNLNAAITGVKSTSGNTTKVSLAKGTYASIVIVIEPKGTWSTNR